jgi:alpha-beta hydrolase superfamily lysophospholipase
MKKELHTIGRIPAVLYGEPAEKGYLFVHGQGGSKEEAAAFAELAVPAGFEVAGIDLPRHGERENQPENFDPWTAAPELQAVMAWLKKRWRGISLRANSIGAYFSMLAFADEKIEKALLVSPIVDMERLICDMMGWAGVTEEALRARGEIPTEFGQTLSWRYLCWVREHKAAAWRAPTSILYAGHDNLTANETIACFAAAHGAQLTIYEPGEHWFHTPDQLDALRTWERKNI